MITIISTVLLCDNKHIHLSCVISYAHLDTILVSSWRPQWKCLRFSIQNSWQTFGICARKWWELTATKLYNRTHLNCIKNWSNAIGFANWTLILFTHTLPHFKSNHMVLCLNGDFRMQGLRGISDPGLACYHMCRNDNRSALIGIILSFLHDWPDSAIIASILIPKVYLAQTACILKSVLRRLWPP